MAPVSIKIDFSEAHAKLQAMILAARNPQRLMKKIGAYAVQRTKRRIRQGIPPPTHPYFEELKRRSGMTTGTPLYAMGHLYRSITHEQSPGGVRVGSPMKYAATHQFGSDGVRKFYIYVIPDRNPDGTIKRNEYGFVLGRLTTRADWHAGGAFSGGRSSSLKSVRTISARAAVRQLVSIRIRKRPFLKAPDEHEIAEIVSLAQKHLEGEAR